MISRRALALPRFRGNVSSHRPTPGDGRASIPLPELYRICGGIVGVASQLYLSVECARMLS